MYSIIFSVSMSMRLIKLEGALLMCTRIYSTAYRKQIYCRYLLCSISAAYIKLKQRIETNPIACFALRDGHIVHEAVFVELRAHRSRPLDHKHLRLVELLELLAVQHQRPERSRRRTSATASCALCIAKVRRFICGDETRRDGAEKRRD